MSKKLLKTLISLTCVAALTVPTVSALNFDWFNESKPEVKTHSYFSHLSDEKFNEALKELTKKWDSISKDNETLNNIAKLRCELLTRIAQNQDFVEQYSKYVNAAKELTSFELQDALNFPVNAEGKYTEKEDEKIVLPAFPKTITVVIHQEQVKDALKELAAFQTELDKLEDKEAKEKYLNGAAEVLTIGGKPVFNSSKTKGQVFVEKFKHLQKMLSDMKSKAYQEKIEILSLFSDEYTILDAKVVQGKDQVGSIEHYKNEIQRYRLEVEKLDEFIGIYNLDVSIFEKHCPLTTPINVQNLEKKNDKIVEKAASKPAEKDNVPNTGAKVTQ